MAISFKKAQNLMIKNKQDAEVKLVYFAFCSFEELFARLETTPTGLESDDVEERQDEHGKNIITTDKRNSTWYRLYEAVVNPFNLILLLIAAVTFFTDILLTESPEYYTLFIILALVTLSSTVAFVQSERSNAAAEKLSKMISNKADVLRDGKLEEVLIEEIVPGDILRLSAGDMFPADVRFISAKDTFVGQSALTGESAPVEKFAEVQDASKSGIAELDTIGLMGSNIVSGSATAVVLATGNDTYFGSMAKSLSGDRAATSFERGVNSVSRLLVRMMLLVVPFVFLINGLAKSDWTTALIFAISVAVGLTPEMLPVIMTSTLAKGAVSMSRHKVIVRSLGAIQTFGEMDILCTDKTGTLTEDKIILERYLNLNGEDDSRILRHAYFNSYFQTGLKNLIDVAIMNRASNYNLEDLLPRYKRVDEIPFDFSRRRMSVVLEDTTGKRQLITKGAVEEMLSVCSFVELNGQVIPLDEEARNMALTLYRKHNTDGLRMIAVAQKNEVPDADTFSVADERDMVLIGLVGFLDPPKESARAALKALTDHGVRTVVLTGDSEGVAVKVCQKVGINATELYTGTDVDGMSDEELHDAVKSCDLFAKLSPTQKERVVKAFQDVGHTVGYMGDGINDAMALRQADVGISVDSAVDIAKETADIILLEKDLMVLEEGVIEGRRTFGNIVKYIKLAASGNFGNILSVLVASIVLPFLPLLPIQILTQNLLNDFSQMGISFDRTDGEYVMKPRRWETDSIKNFMAFMGPLSSVFDVLVFAVMWWIIGANRIELAPLFQAGWFVFGILSQTFVIHVIRTSKIPFLQSRPSAPLLFSTGIVALAAIVIGFSGIGKGIGLATLPWTFIPWLALVLIGYLAASQLLKRVYIRKFGEWM